MTAKKAQRPITANPFANAAPVRAPEYSEPVPGQTGLPVEGTPPGDVPHPQEQEQRETAPARGEQADLFPAPVLKKPERTYKRPIPQADLFVTVPWNLHAGMKDLADIKHSTLKKELITAIEAHFAENGYTPPPEHY